ncbi:serine/threonine protein kinase [Paenibacillus sp. EKM202P]|uniref:serine/threonine-protein kinase n=1 Tax=unclassified Paenibacillus TaxID=185978 RepID=UPI0013EAF771|nr:MULTISPECIES: serine/threonine-protein kinase [unclassified Paenibacillus]KAF6565355.1 serine/threonine protein kinase [Paenibacillus sp. EKM202P]KAF6569320.1 serine/threonine protein kinase [Paenibacillus sp. EKM207P]
MIAQGVTVYDESEEEYEVIEMIGNGNFGFVFKIQRKSDKGIFALKTLPTTFPTQEAYATFINECQMATKVSHPNTIKYFYVHKNKYPNLPPYLIMEYANQGTLMSYLNRQKEEGVFFSNDLLKEFYSQLIQGMKHINDLLVHRDIKADNILIDKGTLKIADFGLAKVATEGTRQLTFKGVGHIKYMAPERWRSEKNTIQNDIYSMGILFYELATLRHPYEVKNEADMTMWQEAHTFQNAVPIKRINPGITNSIVQVINKMIEKNISARYKNWEEIERDIGLDETPLTSVTSLIDNLINVKVVKDESLKTQQLLKQKEESEQQDHVKRINYQFKEHIYEPLKDYVNEFNTKYTGSKMILDEFNDLKRDSINLELRLPSQKRVKIRLRVLYDKDFVKTRKDDFWESRTEVVVRPKLRDQLILAWGYFDIQSDLGFNLLLVEEKDNIYGKWFFMKNKIGAFRQRPSNIIEPFAVEFDGLEKTLSHLNVLGADFNSEIIEGDRFIELVNEILVKNI